MKTGTKKTVPKKVFLDFGRGKELARAKTIDGNVHYVSCREEAERLEIAVLGIKCLNDPDWQSAMKLAGSKGQR